MNKEISPAKIIPTYENLTNLENQISKLTDLFNILNDRLKWVTRPCDTEDAVEESQPQYGQCSDTTSSELNHRISLAVINIKNLQASIDYLLGALEV